MTFRSALIALALLSSDGAKATTIDFNSLAVGVVVTNQFPGVGISLVGSPIAGPRTYALEDTGGNQQSIFGATGNAITPGDNVGGINPPFYDLMFSFDSPIDHFSLMALDAEESVSALAYLGSDLVASVIQGVFLGTNVATVFNGPVYRLELGAVGGTGQFDRVKIALTPGDGPELFDNLTFNNVVPEPSSYLLLGLGLLLLVLFAARHSHGATGFRSAHRPS